MTRFATGALNASLYAELMVAFGIVFTAVTVSASDALTDGDLGVVAKSVAVAAIAAALVGAWGTRAPGLGNPLIGVALAATGGVSWLLALGLALADLTGAILGAGLARALFPEEVLYLCRWGAPILSPRISWAQGTLVESILAFVLVATLLRTGRTETLWPQAWRTGFAYGLLIAGFGIAAAPLTGGIANPARAFGPAVVGGFWSAQFIYWLGPILASYLAARFRPVRS